jgi:cytochrome P450
MEKSPIFLGAVGNVGGQTGVSLALNAEHFRQRRALGYLFTNSALLQHESILQLHINKFIAVLKQRSAEGRPVDSSSWCKHVAIRSLGKPFNESRRYISRIRCNG